MDIDMKDPEIPEEKEPPKKPYGKISLACFTMALCVCLTVLCCKPELFGAWKGTFFQWFQLDKTAAASQIEAETTANLNIRSGAGTDFESISVLPKGSKVFLEENQDDVWVKVKTPDGKTGWCDRSFLKILTSSSSPSSAAAQSPSSGDAVPASAEISLEEAEKPLSVHVSLSRQRVVVSDAKGRTVKEFVCSSGEKGSETPTGTFTVSARGESFYNEKIGEGAYYWTRFYGAYLFHSLPFDENRKMEPEEAKKLGSPASHGCIRLTLENAKWIYDNIPDGTKVVITA